MIRRTPTSGRAGGVVEVARGRDRRSWGILGGRVVADGLWILIGIGGHLAMPPLPHHRAYGSVPRRFGRLSSQDRSRCGNPSESK